MMNVNKMICELNKGEMIGECILRSIDDVEKDVIKSMLGGDVEGVDCVLRWFGWSKELIKRVGKVEKVGCFIKLNREV
jgi:hypothetical protein